jgi:hypothetical protein
MLDHGQRTTDGEKFHNPNIRNRRARSTFSYPFDTIFKANVDEQDIDTDSL